MRVLIDGQGLQTESRRRGIGRYSRNLLSAVAAVRPAWRLELVQNAALEPIDQVEALPCKVCSFQPPFSLQAANAEASERYYGDWLTAQDPDAVLVLSFFERRGVLPRFGGPRPPLYGVLYDLIPLLLPSEYLVPQGDRAWYAHRFRQLLSVDCLLSISQTSADDLRRLQPGDLPRLTVIGGAPDPSFRLLPEADLESARARWKQRLGLEKDFILYVGGCDLRKNMVGAMEAFAAVPASTRRNLDLMIVCKLEAGERRFLEQSGCQLGISDSLKLPGFVRDEELCALYQLCRLFFFPSLYEGLGLPVLEALRCGAPVVASRCSSISEAAGAASWLADPASPPDLAAALEAALVEPRNARRAERMDHARAFTWEKTADLACRAMEAGTSKQPHPPRRRIAWVSPMPPARSGIADYSAGILPYLQDRFDIEVIIAPEQPPVLSELMENHLVLRANEIRNRHQAAPYDLFVYHVGNSAFHVYQLPLMAQFPGLLVSHDYYLGGLVHSALQERAWPATLADEVQREGDVGLATQLLSGKISPWEILRDVPLNRRILSSAEAVMVHSAWSWQRLRPQVGAPIACIPHFMKLPGELQFRAEERRRLELPVDAFVIATLGLVGPPKRLASLLEAVGRLPESVRKEVVVAIVGEAGDDQKEPLEAQAASLGIGAQVRFFGHVPIEDFSSCARAADVCVQLRYPTRGETSGALLHELAAGAACVISNVGPMSEVPDDVAWKVRTPDHEVEDLTDALVRLYREPQTRQALGENAVRFVEKNLAPEQIAAQYAALIDWIVVQRESRDALWSELAANALAGCQDQEVAAALLEPWAQMRESGQRAMRERQEDPGREKKVA